MKYIPTKAIMEMMADKIYTQSRMPTTASVDTVCCRIYIYNNKSYLMHAKKNNTEQRMPTYAGVIQYTAIVTKR